MEIILDNQAIQLEQKKSIKPKENKSGVSKELALKVIVGTILSSLGGLAIAMHYRSGPASPIPIPDTQTSNNRNVILTETESFWAREATTTEIIGASCMVALCVLRSIVFCCNPKRIFYFDLCGNSKYRIKC